ncbi:MAG: BA14K family protein [Rhizobiaceae bacterium]
MFNTATKTKSKLLTAATVTLMAFTVVSTSFTTDANAGNRGRWIAGGIAAGIIGTAIVHDRHRRHRRHYRSHGPSRWERHVRRCYRAYRSYDERSDTYVGYDGYERKCRK